MVSLPPSDHHEPLHISATFPTIYGNMRRNANNSILVAINDAEAIDLVVTVVIGRIVG